jgi:DNA-binding IclR family transcriptional regulator
MKKPKSDYQIQTVTNALRVLGAFHDEAEIGVAELSRRLGLHKNNVFRLLATLEEEGYIEQDPETERYRLGLRALELGHSFSRSRSLVERARPVLDGLLEETGESTHLAKMDGFEVVHILGRVPDRVLVGALRIGTRLPLHATALGKVLLGCAPEDERQAFDRKVVAGGKLPARTERTIEDPAKFFEHVRTVAGHGFALDVGECADGLGCAAAPVHDASGLVVAAISVSAPLHRVSEESLIREICPRVVEAAERLSHDLGHGA